jgi:hypothetical protein
MATINWTNITSLSEIPKEANTASGGYFWVSMLYMVWIILILLLAYAGFEIAIITSTFLILILGMGLVYAGLVDFTHLLVFLGVMFFMILYSYYSNRRN